MRPIIFLVAASLCVSCKSADPQTAEARITPSPSAVEPTLSPSTGTNVPTDPAALLPEDFVGAVVGLDGSNALVLGAHEYGTERVIIRLADGQESSRELNPEWLTKLTPKCENGAYMSADRVEGFLEVYWSCTSGEDSLNTTGVATILRIEGKGETVKLTEVWTGDVSWTESNQVTGCAQGDGGKLEQSDGGYHRVTTPWTEQQDWGEAPEDGCGDDTEAASRTRLF